MLGTGVASFGHASGIHMQNVDEWDQYVAHCHKSELPLHRALPVRSGELLIREMILQLKTGRVDAGYFCSKFGVDILERFAEPFGRYAEQGRLAITKDGVELTRAGLLQIDRLLPAFFQPEHRTTRYT